jgi:hypothetical protein
MPRIQSIVGTLKNHLHAATKIPARDDVDGLTVE